MGESCASHAHPTTAPLAVCVVGHESPPSFAVPPGGTQKPIVSLKATSVMKVEAGKGGAGPGAAVADELPSAPVCTAAP
jgi:hypothetical protein